MSMSEEISQTPFSELVLPTRTGEGSFTTVFPDGWQQGRGAFGGLVLAAMLRAIEAHEGAQRPLRPLRSLTAELCGPTQPGETMLRVETLRAGNAVTTTTCKVIQKGEVQAHAVAVHGDKRASDRSHLDLKRPSVPHWRELEVLPVEPPLGPPFARAFEFRSPGPYPFSGHPEPLAQGWIRPRWPGPARDSAFLAACADAWFPAVLAMESMPRPMATISFTLQSCAGLEGLEPEAPLLHYARDVFVRDGYAVEFRELWGEDGRLVALNQQTVAIIR